LIDDIVENIKIRSKRIYWLKRGRRKIDWRGDGLKKGRRSIRLQDYDYSQPGAYFVTICALDRERLFGDVRGGKMALNELGVIVAESWQGVEQQYEHVDLDAWVVMPIHLHGVIEIIDCRGG
jgi:hypothetical protein